MGTYDKIVSRYVLSNISFSAFGIYIKCLNIAAIVVCSYRARNGNVFGSKASDTAYICADVFPLFIEIEWEPSNTIIIKTLKRHNEVVQLDFDFCNRIKLFFFYSFCYFSPHYFTDLAPDIPYLEIELVLSLCWCFFFYICCSYDEKTITLKILQKLKLENFQVRSSLLCVCMFVYSFRAWQWISHIQSNPKFIFFWLSAYM